MIENNIPLPLGLKYELVSSDMSATMLSVAPRRQEQVNFSKKWGLHSRSDWKEGNRIIASQGVEVESSS